MTAADSSPSAGTLTVMGTGTSVGVPVLGCRCEVCASTDPHNQRTRSGVLVHAPQGNFIIDAAPELRLQLLKEQVDLVQAAVFTHSHADHIFGLDDLRLFGHRLNQDIPLYCEAGVELQIRQSFSYAFLDPSTSSHHFARPRFAFRRVELAPFSLLGVKLQPIRLFHGDLPVLGFRLNNVAFCTDVNRIPEESWPLLEGLDHLIIDCLRERPHPTHFSLAESLAVIRRLRPKQSWLTHLSHEFDYRATNARLPAGVKLAYDGLRLSY